jgi:fucose 4-O-acetylase-like acetyltransferase
MVRRLLYLNGLAILAVILFHTAGWGFVAMFAWTPRYLPVAEPVFDQFGSVSYYVLRLVEQLVVAAIPLFLFVSGYFLAFAVGKRPNLEAKQISARIKALLIPYLLWTLLTWGLKLAEGTLYSPQQYLVMFLTGSTTPAYYYIPLLIQFYLLAPLLAPLARKYWVWLLLLTGVFQFALQGAVTAVLLFGVRGVPAWVGQLASIPKWLFLSRLFWVALGLVVGFHLPLFKAFFARWRWLWLVTAVLLIPLGLLEWELILHLSGRQWLEHRETVLDTVYSLALLFAFFGFVNVTLPANRFVSDMGARSLGIYLAHIPVMEYVARGIYLLFPFILQYQILFQPIMIITGLGIPLLLMALMNRPPFRRFYAYLFG